jgi:hypothetical protein
MYFSDSFLLCKAYFFNSHFLSIVLSNLLFIFVYIERRGLVIVTYTSYSGGLGFE